MLGLTPQASWEEVRAAHRRLAKLVHPDLGGGDAATMTEVNLAFATLAAAHRRRVAAGAGPVAPSPAPDGKATPAPGTSAPGTSAPGTSAPGTSAPGPALDDDPVTFSVPMLPVDAFDTLLVVSSFLGQPWVIDEPYQLVVVLDPPFACRCLLDLVPEAGGSIVTVEVEPRDGGPCTDAAAVRDALVAELAGLGD